MKLQNKETRELNQKAIREELINTGDRGVGSINNRWTNTKNSILKAAEEVPSRN